jgi:hypothetical protein
MRAAAQSSLLVLCLMMNRAGRCMIRLTRKIFIAVLRKCRPTESEIGTVAANALP